MTIIKQIVHRSSHILMQLEISSLTTTANWHPVDECFCNVFSIISYRNGRSEENLKFIENHVFERPKGKCFQNYQCHSNYDPCGFDKPFL